MRAAIAAGLAALVLLAAPAFAAQDDARIVPYSERAFAEAKKRKAPVVVETYAEWCLPCRVQAPILAELLREPRFRDITIIRIGEDTPESVWKRLDLSGYGTMAVYRGGREVARGQPMNEAEMRHLFATRR